MTKKTRLIILIFCVVCFFSVAPILVYYSMGYRYDFAKMKITKTGGIYVRTFPTAEEVIVDSKISVKPGFLANDVFVQSLLPDLHTVLVKKTDYYDYYKTILVEEERVTKLEEILLIRKDIKYAPAPKEIKSPFDAQEKFIIKTGNLYYSNSKENSGLTTTQKATPVLKKVSAFILSPFEGSPAGRPNDNIIWLGADGFLYKSDPANLTSPAIKLIETPIKIIKTGVYKIISNSQNIFVNNNGQLMLLNRGTNALENFYSPVKDAKISPDGKTIVYFNNNSIYISTIADKNITENLLYKSPNLISDFLWLNNNYIIFTAGNKILISEIDYRGNINTVTLPQTAVILDDPTNKTSVEKTITIKSPQIFFNSQEGKLYILTEKTLLVSEKLVP